MGVRTALNPMGTLPEVPDNEDYLVKLVINTKANTASDTTFIVPITAGTYSDVGEVTINWGDGTSTTYSDKTFNQSNCTHTYATAGTYTIKCTNIIDNFADINFYNNYRTVNNNPKKVISCNIVGGIVEIGYQSYYNCTNLNKVKLGNSVSIIGGRAFRSSGISSIVIPSNVTAIKSYTFADCTKLTNVFIPNGLTTIENYAFDGCKSLKNINIPNTVTSIGNYTFRQCDSLTDITIPSSVTSIGNYTFYDCDKLDNVTIPNSVTVIGTYAFYNCAGLTNITIGTGVTTIQANAFTDCDSLTSIVIPDNVTTLGNSAFSNCNRLVNVTIGSGITAIPSSAFYFCDNIMLYDFSHSTSIPSLYSTSSLEHASGCVIKVPSALLSDWQNTNVWKDLTGVVWQGV